MSRRLADLRVPELKAELERRNKERQGVKHVLQKLLAQAISEEGHDPEEYLFETLSEKKATAKKTSRSGSLQGDYDETMEDVSLDNLVVKDEILEDDASADTEAAKSGETAVKPKAEPVDDNGPSEERSSASAAVETDTKNVVKKRELSDPEVPVEAKRVCKEESKIDNEGAKNIDIGALDTEDSINLDINEDEFLNEEGESGVPDKKDEASMVQGVADSSLLKPSEENISGAIKQEAALAVSTQDDKQQDNSHLDVASAEDSKMDSTLSDADKGKDDKDSKKINTSSSSSRNLWVSGLSGSTSAKDLKQLCSKYGKVIGAKVVTNARTPGSRCYGYVTMASAEDANNCIKHLHRTELHGRMILMEKAKSESTNTSGYAGSGNSARNGRNSTQLQRTPHRSGVNRDKTEDASNIDKRKDSMSKDLKADDELAEGKVKDNDSKSDADKDKKKSGSIADNPHDGRKENSRSKGTSQDRKLKEDRNRDRIRQERERHRRPPAQRDFLSFSKIRKEREAQRAREQIRRARSEERRRRAAEQSLRELERRQRAEKHRQRVEKDRLALEREKLRIEREKIEREKHELNRLERERQKLERERLELERLELKRAQMRLEEERAKRNYLYTSSGGSSSLMSRSKQTLPPPPPYEHSTGRSATESGGNSSSARFNMSLPPHLDVTAPTYDMAPNSSSNKSSDRGPPSRDRQRDRDRRDFKRDYPPPPRHASSSHTGGSGNGMKYQSNGTSYEPRQPLPPGTRPRDQSRYTSMDGTNSRDGAGSSMRERTTGSSGHERTNASNTSYRPSESSRRSPKPTSRDHRYSDSTVSMKGDSWTNSGGAENSGRYGGTLTSSGSQYTDTRYGPPYQSTPFF